MMSAGQPLKTDGELDVARSDNVLDFEIRELGIEPQLLDDPRVFAGRQLGIILGLGTGYDHLARRKDQRGGLGFANTHYDGGESLDHV